MMAEGLNPRLRPRLVARTVSVKGNDPVSRVLSEFVGKRVTEEIPAESPRWCENVFVTKTWSVIVKWSA
jgi:ABC-type antimicrobial peptide transport system ATPase subunit